MKVEIRQLTDGFATFVKAAEITSGKKLRLTPSLAEKLIDSEHSLNEAIIFEITLLDIPTFVSTHIARHRVGVTHFVSSNRNANFEVTRNTLVNHMMVINYQALKTICKKRLCNRASKETREVFLEIKRQLLDSPYAVFGKYLQPMCIYRNGKCSEPKPCK